MADAAGKLAPTHIPRPARLRSLGAVSNGLHHRADGVGYRCVDGSFEDFFGAFDRPLDGRTDCAVAGAEFSREGKEFDHGRERFWHGREGWFRLRSGFAP